jgi:diguanylate cyclase (GGDEF)-like protein
MHVDITERKLAELELERMALEDPLTGAMTRLGFDRSLQARLDNRGWENNGLVLIMDIVGLRDINEAHGYDIGDRLLAALTERLCEIAGAEGMVGRMAGDEFSAYLLPETDRTVEQALEAVTRGLHRPFHLGAVAIEIEIQGGCSILGGRRRPVEELVREAELAMFENLADESSQTSWVVYAPELGDRARRRIQLTRELRNALDAEQFELHFQPKVGLSNGRLIAAEALIRWNHPERGLQPPGRFIPIAEQSQLIGPIGHWALRAACRHLRDWQTDGLELVRVSVNVSLVQFLLGDFPARVRRALHDFEVAPGSLSLEITESVFERHTEKLLAEMRELHELGVRLSLDDFGTGYSSLRYLQQYPFDEVKIDRAFTAGLLTDRFSRDIVRSVMNIAEAMGAETVAEGIESPEVAQALLEMGCRIGQGFYYSMPLEAEDFRWLLGTRDKLPLGQDSRQG